jgi:eukaryotic-like serine/threonine-protein kinase
MTPERWRQVTEVFHAARSRDASARASYLEHACAGDGALRAEVDAMLAAHHDPGGLGDRPVSGSIDDVRRLETGAMVGSYRIDRLIGAGGMGEVYRARDTKLGRDVAIKVLPDAFTADPEHLARFKREARLLATLNHPHIGAIYGVEEADPSPGSGQTVVRALVLELVEGETLADRIAKGPIPLDEALPIAKQIAEALEAAHEHGIIHRDLKPANIKVRADGTVKVLDFGLAKALDPSPSATEVSQSPTITSPAATRMGVVMGTAAYMSPEQAHGKAVDKRADIWAFGCVLYEMLTGRRAFSGDDLTDTLATVLKSDPDWSGLPADTPVAIRKLLRRCLEKDPRRRLPDIGSARLEIDDAQPRPSEHVVPTPTAHPSRWRRVGALATAVLVGSVVTGTALWLVTRPVSPAPPRVMRTMITPSAAAPLTIGFGRDLAIAPDGLRLVYVAGTQLLVRRLDQLVPTALTGLGVPVLPTFSPDGQWIAFFDGNAALKKVAVTGGPAVMLSPTNNAGGGATWSPDDTIIFATVAPSTGLLRVGASGGEPEVLTTPDDAQGEVDHGWPEVLPGGEAVLFTVFMKGGIEQDQVAVLDLRTRSRRVLLRGGSHAQYVPPGYLIYTVAGTLRAVAFDLARREVTGSPVPVAEDVVIKPFGAVDASVAADGTLVYVRGGPVGTPRRTLVWVDRRGREEAVAAPARGYRYPRLSSDGMKVAVEVIEEQGSDIWIWDFAQQALTRFTFDPAQDIYPVWTPNGRRLAFRSTRAGPANVFWQAADGTGAVERLTETPNEQAPYAVSPDGTRLVLREDGPKTGGDLMVLALDGERRVTPLIQTTFNERNGEISPDGRWLAYESDESGREEIYVRPFPDVNGGHWQASTGGGSEPLWARSGRELFYRGPDDALLGVPVGVEGSASFKTSKPVRLVEGRYYAGAGSGAAPGRTYDVSPDGRRFLMVKEGGGSDQTAAPPPSIVVVQHWVEELKHLVPTK